MADSTPFDWNTLPSDAWGSFSSLMNPAARESPTAALDRTSTMRALFKKFFDAYPQQTNAPDFWGFAKGSKHDPFTFGSGRPDIPGGSAPEKLYDWLSQVAKAWTGEYEAPAPRHIDFYPGHDPSQLPPGWKPIQFKQQGGW